MKIKVKRSELEECVRKAVLRILNESANKQQLNESFDWFKNLFRKKTNNQSETDPRLKQIIQMTYQDYMDIYTMANKNGWGKEEILDEIKKL